MDKIIEEFNTYTISNKGDVTNIRTGRILKPIETNGGYLQANLSIKGRRKSFMIHQLVAEAFLDKPDNYGKKGSVINHIDGNKWNNCVENLEYVTQKENVNHAVDTGLMDFKGENHPNAVLTQKQADQIRSEYIPRKVTQKFLANKYGVSVDTIYRIIKNKAYVK